jgi:hypothetical protein
MRGMITTPQVHDRHGLQIGLVAAGDSSVPS